MDYPVVYMIGVFDFLHIGHLNIIQKASTLGHLIVGVVNDKAVKKLKGNNRPIVNEKTRLAIINKIKGVSQAILVDDFDIRKVIQKDSFWFKNYPIKMIIKGEDQNHIKGFEELQKEGFIIINLPRTPGISTTEIIKGTK